MSYILTRLAPEAPGDGAAVTALIARAFGPGRFAKAAERLREGNQMIADLSFVARAGEEIVGAVRLWPITIGAAPALFLGPVAVTAALRGQGLGGELIERACEAATAAGHQRVLLVGDEAYFGAFGFSAGPAADVILPGPVDQRRVLVRALASGAVLGLAGAASASGQSGDTVAALEPGARRAYV